MNSKKTVFIYSSCTISEKSFYQIFKKNQFPGQQVQKFNRLLMEGLATKTDVHSISVIPLSSKISKRIFINVKSETANLVNYNYLPMVNLPIIKNLSTILFSFLKTSFFYIKHKNALLVCDIMNFSVSFGSILSSILFRRSIIGVITDLPEHIAKKKTTLFLYNKIINKCNAFIFLTEAMKDKINLNKRKYKVIEGFSDINMNIESNDFDEKYNHKVCLYAGSLDIKYGIKILIDAFIKSNILDSELHLYGSGNYVDEIKRLANHNPKIKYFGNVENRLVIKEQAKATLLISPRPIFEEYSNYSFPSKIIEYLSTGTAVLSTKLNTIPSKYQDYMFLCGDTDHEMALALNDLLSKDKLLLHEYGLRAKRFILEEKNNMVQSNILLSLAEELST